MSLNIIDKEMRLFDHLVARFPEHKKTKLKQFLKYGSVTVNGTVTTAYHHVLRPGDRVELLDRASAQREGLKSRLSFPIVFEDDWLIVIDKPEGLLTIGTEKDKVDTAYFELTAYVRSQSRDGRGRIFIVHRLDREASGLLVFAKRASSKETLQKKWADAAKKYYAVVEGAPEKRSGVIKNYLLEDKFRRVYSADKPSRGAKQAVTRYEVLRDNGRFALLDVTLVTGRKNQIRVHLSGLGHPIAGDDKYGGRSDAAGRLALHAYFLSFRHPETGELKTFKSALPESLEKLVAEPASPARRDTLGGGRRRDLRG
ncbi:MAG: RluA family pseudouridine synthase [Candidatus Omnitrophota bacterium]